MEQDSKLRTKRKPSRPKKRLYPRDIDVLVAMFRLHQANQADLTYESLAAQSGLQEGEVRRAIWHIKKYRPDIILEMPYGGKAHLRLNTDRIATSNVFAWALITLFNTTSLTHPKINIFKEIIAESEVYKNCDEAAKFDLEEIMRWLLSEKVGYTEPVDESKDRVKARDRVWIELEYLKRIV